MAWNDGLTKELDTFFSNVLGQLGDSAVDIIKETVDKYSLELYKEVKKNTPSAKKPENSVNLADRLTRKRVTNKGAFYYGFKILYEGEFQRGNQMVPYEKLANILNYGAVTKQKKKDGTYGQKYENIKATRYISNAITKLKGLDPEINKRFKEKEKELMK